MKYQQFLRHKQVAVLSSGFNINEGEVNPQLFPFQRDIVIWALQLGKAAIFAECGLGKTPIQLEWAKHIARRTGKKVLLLAPLAVAYQTVREGGKFDVPIAYARSQDGAEAAEEQIIITNYEMVEHFDETYFIGVVLDESSILKNFTGKTKKKLLEKFDRTSFKLACTATPAPNDHLELGNHAQFLNVMPSNEMISRWFINDTMSAGSYRLKKHATDSFWQWVTSWAVCLSTPSDLGKQYSDDGFTLPELVIAKHEVKVDHRRAHEYGRLFLDAKLSATDMWREKRETNSDRAKRARQIVNSNPDDFWIIWCDTNYESNALKELFPEAIEVRGSHSVAKKEELLRSFSEQESQIIITKPSIAGFGLNWQHCRNQIFVGVTYSFEKFYQALRRSWRFMVEGQVNVHVIGAASEGDIMQTVERKQVEFQAMQAAMNEAMKKNGLFRDGNRLELTVDIEEDMHTGDNWTLYQGDCVSVMKEKIGDETIDLSIYSPPFSSLYIYSDSIADMGNSEGDKEFFQHFDYLIPEHFRTSKVGARIAVHCKDLPLYKNRDGAAGLNDFPGNIIASFEKADLVLERWVAIWKDPVIEMQRTKNHGLLHKNFRERGEVCRMGMADFVLIFRKVKHHDKLILSEEMFYEPINEDVVSRCLDLWTNERDIVCVPRDVGMNRQYKEFPEVKRLHFSIFDACPDKHTDSFIQAVYEKTEPGRLVVIRCKDQVLVDEQMNHVGYKNTASEIIRRYSKHGFTFQSRCFVTNGYSLIAFRKWTSDMPDKQVYNKPKPPILGEIHNNYIGTQYPTNWDSDGYYSIMVWQKYASPVWYDMKGITSTHEDVWFDINQTKVLNVRMSKSNKDEKHICPLQLDVIDNLVLEYSQEGDLVLSPFAGIGSEGVRALKWKRKFVGIELKEFYVDKAAKYLAEQSEIASIPTLFEWAGIERDGFEKAKN